MENLAIVATQVAILFALMGVGFVGRKIKMFNESLTKGLVDILILIVTPCLIVHVFQRPYDHAKLTSLALAFAIAIAAHLLAIALAAIFIRSNNKNTLVVLKTATVFSNAGFMGIPLEQAVLGDEGVFFGVVYVVVFNLFMWSWGLWQMGGKPNYRQMLINPGTVGLAFGLPLFFFSVKLPQVIGKPVEMMASLNTPIAMIVIGYYLAGAKFAAILRMPAAWTAAAIRLLGYPLLIVGMFWMWGESFDRMMKLAIVTAASAPVAAMVTMFAAKYNRDVDVSVGLVSASTLMSIVTMPFVIALAMAVLNG
jgi:predicted permease